jgi:hypothetical protein
MADDKKTFLELMDLEQALSSIRRFGAGETTFLIALKDVKTADSLKNAATIDVQNAAVRDSCAPIARRHGRSAQRNAPCTSRVQ